MENNDFTTAAKTCKSPTCGRGLIADEYQRLANRTAAREPVPITPEQSDLLNWITGLTGEAGEVADLVKKGIFHGQGIDKAKIKRELGDVLWYVAACCKTLGFSLSEVMEENVEKLRKRFPEGFSTERSTFREEVDLNGRPQEGAIIWEELEVGQLVSLWDMEDGFWAKCVLLGPHPTLVDTWKVTDNDPRSDLHGVTYTLDRYELTDARYARKRNA